jgi:hypothetical protein
VTRSPTNFSRPSATEAAAAELAEAKLVNGLQKAAADEGRRDPGLKAKLDAIEVRRKLAITEAVNAVEKERDELKNGLARAELEKQLAEKSLKGQVRNADQGSR